MANPCGGLVSHPLLHVGNSEIVGDGSKPMKLPYFGGNTHPLSSYVRVPRVHGVLTLNQLVKTCHNTVSFCRTIMSEHS